MKSALFVLFFTALVASVFSLEVTSTDGIFSFAPEDLYKPLDDVLAEIAKEELDGQSRLSDSQASVNLALAEEKKLGQKLDASKVLAAGKRKDWDEEKALLKTREQEFATNDDVRSKEETQLKKIDSEVQKLSGVGPADGTIGKLPGSAIPDPVAKLESMKLVAEAATQLLQTRPDAQKIINAIQRTSHGAAEVATHLSSLKAEIVKEREQDTAAVDKQKEVVAAKAKLFEDADALRVSRQNSLDRAKTHTQNAKSVHAHQKKEFDEAQALRQQDIDTIKQAKSMIKSLVETSAEKAAGPSSSLLQLQRTSKAITRIRQMIVVMQADVDNQENVQKLALDNQKRAYDLATKKHLAASQAHEEQIAVFKKAEREWRALHGEFQGSEMALSQELAVSQQERSTINSVRQMLKKLQSAQADTLGDCPLDAIGRVCSGNGDCKTNATRGEPVKYCECMPGSGRTGWDCSLCKFGWKLTSLDGSSSGQFCQQKYIASVTLLQTSSGDQFSAEDLNDMVSNLQISAGRHASVTGTQSGGGIEALLAGLELTLDNKEKMMRKERDNLAEKTADAEKRSHAEKKTMGDLKAVRHQKKTDKEQQRDLYTKILQQYTFEAPMRKKEKELLNQIDAIMVKLQGSTVHQSTDAITVAHTNSPASTASPTIE